MSDVSHPHDAVSRIAYSAGRRCRSDTAAQALSSGKNTAACGVLTDFVDHVSAQAGKKLTASLAGQLVAAGTRIKAVIGCRTK
jgi:hypothetical protein